MTVTSLETMPADTILGRFERAKARRSAWEGHWRECYDYAMPQRDGPVGDRSRSEKDG
jgi:hypothetical protein